MSELLSGLGRLLVRIVLFVMALIFVLSVLAAALLLAAFWALRVLWSRITGRPLKPWAFSFNPRTHWDRFYGSAGQWQGARRGNTYEGEVRTSGAAPASAGGRREPLVIDVDTGRNDR